MKKSLVGITLANLLTLIIVIILLGLANTIPINNFYATELLKFINLNILTIILFFIFLFLGELFFLFGFPFNVPGAVFYAYGGYFVTKFVFEVFLLVDAFMKVEIFSNMSPFRDGLSLIVFLIILIIGILKIIARKGVREENSEKPSKEIEWGDIKQEIKIGFYNLAVKFRKTSEMKKEERVGKKKGKR